MTIRHRPPSRKRQGGFVHLGVHRALFGGDRFGPPRRLALPLRWIGVTSGGVPIISDTAAGRFVTWNTSIWNATTYYVKPSTGSNANNGTTVGTPFATLTYAVRTAAAGSRIVCLEAFVEEPFDIRSTDASQATQQAKLVDGNGFNVILRSAGPDVTTQTYVVDGVNTKCYKTTLVYAGTGAFQRLLRTDILDSRGLPTPFKKYASAAALNAVTTDDGWFYDTVGKVLWVRIGNGTNVETQKAILKGLHTASAGTSRCLVSGAAICFSGIRMEGMQFVMLDAGGRASQLWLHNCNQYWAIAKGADLTQANLYVATSTVVYASEADGVNAFAPSPIAGKGLIQTALCTYERNGDVRTFAVDGTLQGISAHGGSHHVSFGTTMNDNNGQCVADTCVANSTDITWCALCTFDGGITVNVNVFLGGAGANAARIGYFDTCTSVNAPAAGDISISTNASAYSYRSSFPVIGAGAALGSYRP